MEKYDKKDAETLKRQNVVACRIKPQLPSSSRNLKIEDHLSQFSSMS